jgi:O-antigen/teichoic acid export membrane protein
MADIIATHWLNLDGISVALGKEAVYGAAFLFSAQFPGSIYRSLLVGAQAQVVLNGVMAVGALMRHIGGVIVVFVCPTILTYLIWHVSIALLETLVRGNFAWNTLGIKRKNVKWVAGELRPIWQQVAGMSGAALLGALTVQMDKTILSRMATVEQFGYYTIASTVAGGMLQLIYPLIQAVLPRAIELRSESAALRKLSIKLILLIALLSGFVALVFVTVGDWLLTFWLRNPAATIAVYPLLAILLVGTCLNTFYNVGYINWIVHEKILRVFQVNALALALSVALIPPLITLQGTIGAAFGWVVINLIGFVLSLEWLNRKQDE